MIHHSLERAISYWAFDYSTASLHGASLVLLLCLILITHRALVGRRRLPPGPKGLPLIGNVPDLPSKVTWVALRDFSRKYGDVMPLNIFGETTIVLNSMTAATELLEKWSINAGRPLSFVFLSEILVGIRALDSRGTQTNSVANAAFFGSISTPAPYNNGIRFNCASRDDSSSASCGIRASSTMRSDYPFVDRFRPERFLKEGKLDTDALDPSTIVFSSGRRICPGRHFVEDALFINIASALHVFNIAYAFDKHGTPITVAYKIGPGLISAALIPSTSGTCTINYFTSNKRGISAIFERPDSYHFSATSDSDSKTRFVYKALMGQAILSDIFSSGVLNIRDSLVFGVIALSIVHIVFSWRSSRRSLLLPSPPGPSGLPFIGNVFDIPQERSWVTYGDLAVTYGDVIGVKALGQTLIVLNSLNATIDLLEKRSAMYSDRPISVVSQMIGWTRNLAFKQYGDDWREMRRMLWRYIQPGTVEQYQPVQHRGAVSLLKHLSEEDSSNLDDQIKSYCCKILLNVMYGLRFDHVDIPRYIEVMSQLESAIAEAFQPGAFLVEFLPCLRYVPKWLPGTRWQQRVSKWKTQLDSLVEEPYRAVTKAMKRGEVEQSLFIEAMDSIRQGKNANEMEGVETLIKETISSAFHAGADALAAVLYAFVCAMVLNPEVQKRAQEELDRVVGCDRLPVHSDRPSLPYIEAILKETYRWHNPVPLGVAHRCTKDNVYRGWRIPEGATVMFNVWAMLHDADVFPEPEVFRPERFLKDGQLNMEVMQPEILTFGVGRRVCPGKHFADDSLFISIASILHIFTITNALDAQGFPIPVKAEVASGFLSLIKKFDCSVQPRSEAHAALIQEV